MRVNAHVRVHVCVHASPEEQLAEGCLETETPLDCILKVLRTKCSVLCCWSVVQESRWPSSTITD